MPWATDSTPKARPPTLGQALEPAGALDVHIHRRPRRAPRGSGRRGTGTPAAGRPARPARTSTWCQVSWPTSGRPRSAEANSRSLLALHVRVVRLDGGGQQGHVEPPRRRVAVGHHRVEPGRVHLAADELRPVEQVEQEGLVRRAAADHRRGLLERARQAGPRLAAVPAPGDHLGDHGVELRRDDVAGSHAGVDADARARGQGQVLDLARRGREAAVRVLGRQPGLDGVAADRRRPGRDVRQQAAGGDVQLQLDDVDAGGHLGDRVLDLQPGVDLEERQQPLARARRGTPRSRR